LFITFFQNEDNFKGDYAKNFSEENSSRFPDMLHSSQGKQRANASQIFPPSLDHGFVQNKLKRTHYEESIRSCWIKRGYEVIIRQLITTDSALRASLAVKKIYISPRIQHELQNKMTAFCRSLCWQRKHFQR